MPGTETSSKDGSPGSRTKKRKTTSIRQLRQVRQLRQPLTTNIGPQCSAPPILPPLTAPTSRAPDKTRETNPPAPPQAHAYEHAYEHAYTSTAASISPERSSKQRLSSHEPSRKKRRTQPSATRSHLPLPESLQPFSAAQCKDNHHKRGMAKEDESTRDEASDGGRGQVEGMDRRFNTVELLSNSKCEGKGVAV